ncbi:MAG: hypothetical protein ACLRX5_00505 [Slackia sp.]
MDTFLPDWRQRETKLRGESGVEATVRSCTGVGR